jgi:Cdc6-like AAA superfamily ATPase
MIDLAEVVVNLARLGIRADADAVRQYLRRLLRQTASTPEHLALRAHLGKLLVSVGTGPSGMRAAGKAPVDTSTFQSLLHTDDASVGEAPLLDASVRAMLAEVIEEHRQHVRLEEVGLEPTRSILLVGPPGVGKTMTARFLAHELSLPLLTLDLAAVMSSFLGRTGQNLRSVLDHARAQPCVLLLDEFDALAKRRDDPTDIGELKRIVNVLLLEIERWPSHGLLVAATNHPEILDRAVERRFSRVIALPLPDATIRRAMLERALRGTGGRELERDARAVLEFAVALTEGYSGSAITRLLADAERRAVLTGVAPTQALLIQLRDRWEKTRDAGGVRKRGRGGADGPDFGVIADMVRALVVDRGLPYREAAAVLGVSHMTVFRAAHALAEGKTRKSGMGTRSAGDRSANRAITPKGGQLGGISGRKPMVNMQKTEKAPLAKGTAAKGRPGAQTSGPGRKR